MEKKKERKKERKKRKINRPTGGEKKKTKSENKK